MAQRGRGGGGARRQRSDRPATVTRPELLVAGSDATFRSFVYDALAFLNRFEAVRDGYGALIGITGVQYTILASIFDLQSRQQVGVTTIAGHLHLSHSFIALETGKLVDKGLVSKVQDAEDGRRVILQVTDKARERLERLAVIQRQVNDMNFKSLSRAEFKSLCATMRKLVFGTEQALTLLKHLMTPDTSAMTAGDAHAAGKSAPPGRYVNKRR